MEKTITELHYDSSVHPEKSAILVIDDSEEILDLLVDDFSEKHTVFTALSAKQGLNILNEQIVNLIISDVMMDGMDGFELCSSLKSSFEFGHIPIILLTAKDTLQAKITGLELGADAYIEKPFSSEFLQAQVESLLKNRSKLKQYFARTPLVHIKTIAHSRQDELFLERLNDYILKNLHNKDLEVEDLAAVMNMSRPTLYRKIKSISDMSPNELINLARLKKAAELLSEGELKMYEISDVVGYSSQTYFGRSFLKQFGILPSEYVLKRV